MSELIDKLHAMAKTGIAPRYRRAATEAAARIAELEAALKPFADEAARYDPDENDNQSLAWASTSFRIGQLRAARAARYPAPSGE